MRIGILRETKIPPDRRVPFSPAQLAELQSRYPDHKFLVQPSNIRCFSNREYEKAGIRLLEDISDCDVLFGVKEVEIDSLIPEKTYVFFSHTAKEQPYNRKLLQEIVAYKISLLDYEYFTDRDGIRLVAFGRWAGICGTIDSLYEIIPPRDWSTSHSGGPRKVVHEEVLSLNQEVKQNDGKTDPEKRE